MIVLHTAKQTTTSIQILCVRLLFTYVYKHINFHPPVHNIYMFVLSSLFNLLSTDRRSQNTANKVGSDGCLIKDTDSVSDILCEYPVGA